MRTERVGVSIGIKKKGKNPHNQSVEWVSIEAILLSLSYFFQRIRHACRNIALNTLNGRNGHMT